MTKKVNGKNKKSFGVTNDDIMEFLEDNMVMRGEFGELKGEVEGLKGEFGELKGEVKGLRTEFNEFRSDVSKRLTRVEATMVTKSYLDDKLADLKGDLIEKMRKQESKINTLIDLLAKRSILKKEDVALFRKEFQIFPSLKEMGV